MLVHLAFRNLVHDRTRLAVTLIGVAVAVLLVGVQGGLYQGFTRMITAPIAMARADLWVVPAGARIFEDAGLLPARSRERALGVPGVAAVSPLLVRFADWRRRDGGRHTVSLIGIEPATGLLQPWSMIAGGPGDLAWPDGVVADRSYLDELGIGGLGGTAEIGRHAVRVVGLTSGVRSFTTIPYVFASRDTLRRELGLPPGASTFLLVRVNPGADRTGVAGRLARLLPGTEVLTREAFAARTRAYWLGSTGAGAALGAGVLLSLVVGAAIVAQTLYASTADNLVAFATLRAMGASRRRLLKIVLAQAAIAAVAGYALGMSVVLALVRWADGAAPLVLGPGVAAAILAAVAGMCMVAALAPVRMVLRLDPVSVLRR